MMLTRKSNLILACLLLVSACQPAEKDATTASPAAMAEARMGAGQVTANFWQAIATQDEALLASTVATDGHFLAFGTDAPERWASARAFLQAESELMKAFDIVSLEQGAQTLEVAPDGNTAWFSTMIDLTIREGGKESELKGLRSTGVLERRKDGWKIVQLHTSQPVSGQMIAY